MSSFLPPYHFLPVTGRVNGQEEDPREKTKDGKKNPDAPPARNLAGRVRFSDALSLKPVELLSWVTLKALSSPKPPSPAMYFHQGGDQKKRSYIPKTELSASEGHRPNGRKVYLHRQDHQTQAETWKSRNQALEHPDQRLKMRCQPMDKNQDFYFHLDFDNLSDAELTLLLTSLAPNKHFLHRLGLGKSLGLGSVEVRVEGVFLIDRNRRYCLDALDEPRYHQVFSDTPSAPAWATFDHYHAEAEALPRAVPLSALERDARLVDAETQKILETVGDPQHVKVEVKPPLAEEQTNDEEETFQWFANNDKPKKDKSKAEIRQQTLPYIPSELALKPLRQNRD